MLSWNNKKNVLCFSTSHARMAMTFGRVFARVYTGISVQSEPVPSIECCVQYLNSVMSCHGNLTNFASSIC